MGMSSSQARLLTLTARLHSIEHKAQKLEADKLRLANDSDRVYETYLERLDATKLQYSALTADGTMTFKDATLNAMENGIIGNWNGETSKNILFLQSLDGKVLVTPAVAAKYGLVSSADETRDLDTFVQDTTGKNKTARPVNKQVPVYRDEKHMVDKVMIQIKLSTLQESLTNKLKHLLTMYNTLTILLQTLKAVLITAH